MKRRFATVLAAAILAALALAPAVQAKLGIVPGSTFGKAHQVVPMDFVPNPPSSPPGTHLGVDTASILAVPFTSQAGAHPDATGGGELSDAAATPVKDFFLNAPPGFIGNPTAAPPCDREAFRNIWDRDADRTKGCSPASQVGVATIELQDPFPPQTSPVYRLIPSEGYPATFGFATLENAVIVNASVRTDGDYGVTLGATDIEGHHGLVSSAVTLWGTPADPIHDPDRWNTQAKAWGASSGIVHVPLIQLAADCSNDQLLTTVRIDGWQKPGIFLPDALPPGDPSIPFYSAPAPQPTGCEKLSFKPSITMVPSAKNADSPTGVSVQLDILQNYDPAGLSTPPLKKAVVTLPEGMSFNPSAADGLEGCTEAQIGLLTTHGAYPNPIRFAKGDARCPQASKIGTAHVDTALLDDPIEGDVYLATPYENPFGTLGAIYLVLRGPGFVVKAPGKVDIGPNGQLTTTFDYNPQLPFDSLDLDFFGGPRAPLATSPVCGNQPILTELTPWSAPQSGPPARPANHYDATQGPAGAPCSDSLASRPFAPVLTAGTSSPIAGGHSAFTMRLTRPDGHQELAGLTVKPPLGFTASLRNVPYCSEAAIAVSATRSGERTAAHPDCPAASEVGHTLVGAGAGPTPFFVKGTAYLAGPYKGAPLSLAILTPALAGGTPANPVFDLGTVVVRVALYVNPRSAQITAVSDPVPQSLEDVPLRIRDIRVALDRPNWGINPTSCAEKSFEVGATGQSGATASLSNRFQVLECGALGFKPRIDLTLKGGTGRGAHPAFTAVVRPRPGDANVAKASVTLPHSAFLDQAHIRTVCTRVQFAARQCPAGAIYGHATATTPLLDQPLSGPVYLRSSDNLLPDLVVALKGPESQPIEVELAGRVDSAKAGIRNTFELLPDAPVSTFTLTMQGGKKGLIVNSRDLCARPSFANARLGAQNGRRYDFKPRVVAKGCGGAAKTK